MLDLFKKLNPYAFIIALCLGILYSYLVQPSPTIITKYPTKEDSPVYKDKSDTCYRYRIDDTPCPADISQISKIPIQ
jgi:hypothetical protein